MLESDKSGSTSTSYTIGNWGCKYRLPCGYCELKKEQCNWWQSISVPCDNSWKVTPTWNEGICSAERRENGTR